MTARTDVVIAPPQRKTIAAWRRAETRAAQLLRKYPIAVVSLIVLIVFVGMTAAAPLVASHGYDQISIAERFEGPSAAHWFGTDGTGRDVYSRVVYGGRVSLVIGLTATAIAAFIAGIVGILSGYFGGWIDLAAQRVVDIWMAFPGLVFVLFLVAMLGASQLSLILMLGVLFGGAGVRIIRSNVLALRSMPYIEAARCTGASEWRIVLRHVIPGTIPFVIVIATVQVGAIIIAESSLAFLGYGVPPPHPSWGRMLQEAQLHVVQYPYLALFPGLAITVTVYAFNMIGDALRDELDPRLRNTR